MAYTDEIDSKSANVNWFTQVTLSARLVCCHSFYDQNTSQHTNHALFSGIIRGAVNDNYPVIADSNVASN